jgi:ketosteroid isomerase-like protein
MHDEGGLRNAAVMPYTRDSIQFVVHRARRSKMSMSESTGQLIERYWQTMNSNDFRAVGDLLHDDFVLDYPQSGERLRGREHNALLNEEYPSPGPWRFVVERLLAGDDTAVTDVRVYGAEVETRAISFFEIRDGRIRHITEYWPDPFEAPVWRVQWMESIPEES